jgi:hypothetical protein
MRDLIHSTITMLYHTSSIPQVVTYVEYLVQRFHRKNPWGLMPPEAPPIAPKAPRPPRAPRGFRFASEPPDLNDLVHLDNDHPYLRARTGERVDFLAGYGKHAPLTNIGTVLGRMNDDDPRARVVNPGSKPSPGLYIQEQGQQPRWYSNQYVYRQTDGRLTIRK